MPPVFDDVDLVNFVSSEEATAGYGFRAVLTRVLSKLNKWFMAYLYCCPMVGLGYLWGGLKLAGFDS